MKKYFLMILISGTAACNQPAKNISENEMEKMSIKADSAVSQLKNLSYAVKKDLVCGMPVSAGVSDTALYKGKLYGFCSPECKAEFLKSPEEYLSAK